jgi:hypothetical protein
MIERSKQGTIVGADFALNMLRGLFLAFSLNAFPLNIPPLCLQPDEALPNCARIYAGSLSLSKDEPKT